jgi:hypothetical protein
MLFSLKRKKPIIKVSLLCLLALSLGSLSSFAFRDSAEVPTQSNLSPQTTSGGSGNACSYYFVDSYYGAVAPGSLNTPLPPLPPTPPAVTTPMIVQVGSPVELYFFNSVYDEPTQTVKSMPTKETPQTPCAGTYQIVFSVVLQATSNVASITITPVIKDTAGTTIYPTASTPTTMTIYPQCNNPGYTSTPYCTVSSISGSIQATLPANDKILAPTLMSTEIVNVVGGQFMMFFLHS